MFSKSLALQYIALVLLAGAAALLAGCRTVSFSAANSERNQETMVISRRNAVMAEALANYCMGVLREGQRDTGAVSNYLRAVELEPELTSVYLRVAVQYVRRGDFNKAIAVMEEACRANPQSSEALLQLSQICQVVNRLPEAKKAAREAIEVAPKSNKAYIQLAALYIAGQDEKQSRQILLEALDAGVTDRLHVLRMLGDLHAQKIRSGSNSADLQSAISYYEQAAEFPTDDLSMVYLQRLGDLYLIKRQVGKALLCFEKVAVHDPDNTQIRQKLALCHVALGNKEKALGYLEKIAAQEQPGAELYYYLGEMYDSLGDEKRAIENFKAARDAEPSDPKSYLKMVSIHLRDNPAQAQEVLRDGLKHLPKERLFIEILVQIYLRNHQYTEAMSLFEQMRSTLSPSDPILNDQRFYIHYGIAAQQCRQIDKAMALYTVALELNPSSLEARMRLAILLVWMKSDEEALSIMEDAVLETAKDPAAWFFYALICSRAERYKQALAAFKITEDLVKPLTEGGAVPLDTFFYFNYGAACERAGDFETAEQLLAKAIRLDPENCDAFNYLAYMWAEKGVRLDEGYNYALNAIDLDPENAAYIDTLGWIEFKQANYPEALEQITCAREILPDDPTILDHLGDVLEKLGREKEAIEAWRQSFQHDSSNVSVERKLRERGIDVNRLRRNWKPVESLPPTVEE